MFVIDEGMPITLHMEFREPRALYIGTEIPLMMDCIFKSSINGSILKLSKDIVFKTKRKIAVSTANHLLSMIVYEKNAPQLFSEIFVYHYHKNDHKYRSNTNILEIIYESSFKYRYCT